ncbi:omega-hydroxyceramide transacylase-like [Ammospiza maritima maritima]
MQEAGETTSSYLDSVFLPLYELKEYMVSRLKTSLWGLIPGGYALRLLRETLDKFLPPNAHELVSGKLHIILTRLHDWRCVTVSEFTSKEELIQALTCSCFIPLYFGVFPPKFHGVRYVDGELAMWRADFVSRSTITISAFAGEYDICPKDGPAAFLTFQLSDCEQFLQVARAMSPLQQPSCPDCHLPSQVIDRFYIQGYQDAISFLKRLRDFQVNYFEGFTLSLAQEETLHLKPRLGGLHARAADHEEDTKKNPGINKAVDEEQ